MALGSQTDLSLTEIRFLHRDETCMKKRSGRFVEPNVSQQQQQPLLTGGLAITPKPSRSTDAGILDAISRLSSSSAELKDASVASRDPKLGKPSWFDARAPASSSAPSSSPSSADRKARERKKRRDRQLAAMPLSRIEKLRPPVLLLPESQLQ
ncbi:hypothetical protein BDP81DRAFT_391631 [Colletotrichum phormii]|uniref:Uncharacterized protein n=1 Tax=Colletotrichum phormii TaxID=359342 RepID=A0AAI9ZWM9_9PEZI|nr:uncharacterized protein BDP81DRAFT_391631 [Colletotrichum phormii]KAK1639538.1 hypothetical protein BDP81DRAFT_391631 [Colletotrichum phormii]